MDSPHPDRAPGARDPDGRRRDVLDAARRLFAAHGYADTSVRAIARLARVNQAQVVTFFGSKEALYLDAVGRFSASTEALDGDLSTAGAQLADTYLRRWEEMGDDDPWPALVRSAAGHPPSNDVLRTALHDQLAAPLTRRLGDDPAAQARSAMVQCLIGGMIMERYVFRIEPAASLPLPVFAAALAASLQHALTGPMGESGTRPD